MAGTAARILSVDKIWDAAPHNAFTDLLRFRDRWWCTFREAESHGDSIGTLRVLVAEDGDTWSSAAESAVANSVFSSTEGVAALRNCTEMASATRPRESRFCSRPRTLGSRSPRDCGMRS